MIAHSVYGRGRGRHFTAQGIYQNLVRFGSRLSLATAYNTLNGFRDAGMLRKAAIFDGNFFFDTNKSEHVHIVTENGDRIHAISDAADRERAIIELRRLAGTRKDTAAFRVVV